MVHSIYPLDFHTEYQILHVFRIAITVGHDHRKRSCLMRYHRILIARTLDLLTFDSNKSVIENLATFVCENIHDARFSISNNGDMFLLKPGNL